MDLHAGLPVAHAGAPLEAGGAVMILLHGRNAGPANILDLVPRLDRPRFTYLAPTAANRTWYPHSFLADVGSNEPWLGSALQVIDSLVGDLEERGIPKAKIVLAGFSQGACLTAEFAVRHPARYGGVVVFSGGLIGPPGTSWDAEGSFAGTPVLMGCSDTDAHVPKTRVDESAAIFTRMGARVVERIYPGMGHLVNDDEIAFAQGVMDEVLGALEP